MRGGSKGTDILVVGTNVASADQILILKAKVFREVLTNFRDQVVTPILDSLNVIPERPLVCDGHPQVVILTNYGVSPFRLPF